MAANAAHAQNEHPPLARDANDNLVEIPDGTRAWRICRQTTGRPREIFGPDKAPLRFPLERSSRTRAGQTPIAYTRSTNSARRSAA